MDPHPKATPVSRSFGSGVANLAAARMVTVVAGFLTGIVGARLIGTDGLGAAGVVIALGSIGAIACNAGVNIATIYLLGRRPQQQLRVIGAMSTLAAVGAAVAVLLIALLATLIGPLVSLRERLDLFVLAAALGAGIMVYEFGGAVLLGLGRPSTYTWIELLRGAGTLVITTLLLASVWRSDAGFVASAGLAYGVAGIVALHRAAKVVGRIRPVLDRPLLGEAVGIGLRGQVGNVLQFVNLRLDQLLVPAFLSLSTAGVYLIAVRISEALAQLGGAAGSLIFPEVARQEDRNSTETTERVIRVLTLVMLAAGLVLGLVAQPLLELAFGEEFGAGTGALRILLLAMLPLTIARVLAGDLKGRGRPGLVSVAMGLAVVATVLLNVVLIPRFGIEGAAMASVVAYGLTAIVLTAAFLRLTGASLRDLLPRASDVSALIRFAARLPARRWAP